MRLPPDRLAGYFPQPSARTAWTAPARPRHWLTVRRAGSTAPSHCCDGWDAVIALLPGLGRGVYHVRSVESDQVIAIVTRRAGGWDLSSWKCP